MINKVILVGNMGKDPESRFTAAGMQIVNITVATTKRVKKGEEWEDKTEWHNCVAFNNKAHAIAEYSKKGTKAYVEGELSTSSWTTETGEKKYKTEIIINVFKVLSGGKEREQNQAPQQNNQKLPPVNDQRTGGNEDLISDLPF